MPIQLQVSQERYVVEYYVFIWNKLISETSFNKIKNKTECKTKGCNNDTDNSNYKETEVAEKQLKIEIHKYTIW